MSRLPNDICRCHDESCPSREICERWKQRETGRVHTASLMCQPGCEQYDYGAWEDDE